MSKWTGTITEGGTALLAEWGAGKTLSMTGAKAGEGLAENPAQSTELENFKQAASIVTREIEANSMNLKLQIAAHTEEYVLNQFGIYARLEDGEDVLFALFQNEHGVGIPTMEEMPNFVYSFYATLTFSHEGNLSVTIDGDAWVSTGTLEEFKEHFEKAISETLKMTYDADTLTINVSGGGSGGGGGGSDYVLPTATAERLGGVKVGGGIDVEEDGTISTNVEAVTEEAASAAADIINEGMTDMSDDDWEDIYGEGEGA